MTIPHSTLYRIAAALALAAGLWAHGYMKGREGPEHELLLVRAHAEIADAQYRRLEKEVQDAQKAHVSAWRTARRDADAAWVRLKADSRSRVPALCPEPGSPSADQRDGLEAAGGESDRDLLPALVGALETGERLEATLQLCQAELRQCAGLR